MESWQKLAAPHERLRWSRERRYSSAAAAARAMGVEYSTYAGHENGNAGFRHAADRYSAFFRVSFDWLLTGRGSPTGREPLLEIYDELPPEAQRQAMEYLEFLRARND